MRNAALYTEPVEKSANPFRYGGVARGAYFADRREELAGLIADVRGGQDVVVISPRRLGKTSLVDRAIEELRRRRAKVAYVDLFAVQTLPELAEALAKGIFDGLLSRRARLLERAQELASRLSLAPRITLGDDGRPRFEFLVYEREEDVLPVIDELLATPGRVAAESSAPVVLVLDEFQQIAEVGGAFPARFRTVFQQQPEVAHVYLGSKRHLMTRLFMEKGEALYRSAKPLALGPIAPAEFGGFLRERFATGGVVAPDEALERILSLTGGLPYETQELCSFAWTRAVPSGLLDVEAIEQALEDVLDSESARYVTIWDELSSSQRKLLRALALEPGTVFAEAYRRRHRLGSASTVQRALEALDRRELVEPRVPDGGYLVSDLFLRLWLRRLG
jgi:AAA+ ATPase superfamily predicted ATPase